MIRNQKKALYESIMKRVAKTVKRALNESMIMPAEVEQVWWDGSDFLLVKGADGYFYDCYPQFGDAYQCKPAAVDYVEKVAQELGSDMRAQRNRIAISAYQDFYEKFDRAKNGDEDHLLGILVQGENPNGRLVQTIQRVLSGKGFGQLAFPVDCEWGDRCDAAFFPYVKDREKYSDEWIVKRTKGLQDVTDIVADDLNYDASREGCKVVLKRLQNRSKYGIPRGISLA